MSNPENTGNTSIAYSEDANKLALVVGVNNSASSDYRASLQGAERDAFDMAWTLESSCGFKLVTSALHGQHAKTGEVQQAIVDLANGRAEHDFLLFYFSGHAQPVELPGGRQDIYLVTYDFKENHVKLAPTMHISMRWLREILHQKTQAGAVLLILDCCYAGNILLEDANTTIDLGKLLENLLKESTPRVPINSPKLILTATGYNVTAQEENGHGLMTYWLLNALRGEDDKALDEHGQVSINSLHNYLKAKIPEQHPNLAGEWGSFDWVLAQYPHKSTRFLQELKENEENERRNVISEQITRLITTANFFEKLTQASTHSQTQPFDYTLCREATLDDLKIEQVIEFFKILLVQQQDDFHSDLSWQVQLQQMSLTRNLHLTYGTLLCFGLIPTNWLPGAFTRCTYWKGGDRHGGWINDREYRGNLLEQYESSLSFLKQHIRVSRVIGRDGSKEEFEVPFRALEEALANALIHREYADSHDFQCRTEGVHIDVFDDRIEISSPGAPPPPMNLKLLQEEAECHPRNPQIMRIFYLKGHVEKVGTGIQRMRRLMTEAGLPPPKFELSETKTFKVVLDRPRIVTEEPLLSDRYGQGLTPNLSDHSSQQSFGTYASGIPRQIFTELYDSHDKANLVASDIGLQLGRIEYSPAMEIYWGNIWIEAKLQHKELDLIERVQRDYLRDEKIIQILAHITHMRTKILPPEALDDFVQEPPDNNIIQPPQGLQNNRWWQEKRWQRIVLLILIVMVVLGSGGYAAFRYFHSCPSGICVTNIGGESIGISDGSFAFDTTLPDGSLKSQAAQAYSQNNINQAQSLLNQAIAMNSNDAEALIYQEDLTVVTSGRPYVTIVVGTMLSGSNLTVGRDDLQGAYVAQREFNDGSKLHGGVQVRLLIANAGSQTDYVSNITQQIVQLSQADNTFVGVMGWPFSAYTLSAITPLFSARIPLVSQSASSDELTNASPYFFRVVPPDKQEGILGAKYAIETLHARKVALFDDPNHPYSGPLAQDFLKEFQNDGGQLAVEEKYTVGQPGTLPSELQDALTKKPDLIYFSGYASDANTLLSNQLPPNLPVLGGDALYELGAYSVTAHASGFTHLYFTSDAYPDEWDILGYDDQKPAFFSEYPQYFDPNNSHQGSPYGFTRADSEVMVAYDATLAMLSGCNIALSSGKQSITPQDLQRALKQLNGANAVQGVSGQIAFGSDGDPINKAVVLLYVDSQGFIHMDPTILGQFIKQ